MIKSKKQMIIVIGVFCLVLLLGTVTYAFFNYTRTGSSNVIKVGRISFITRQTETINLTNVFPIDRANVDTDTDNVDEVVIEIEGDTDYVDGIEYLVSSVNSNIYTNTGKLVPISLDITVDDLGTSSDSYFTARDSKNATIYKRLVGNELVGDQMLLVGFIKPNTASGTAEGIDGSITIKAFFDKDKIAISDTYDGNETDNNGTTNNWVNNRTILTTNEWNAIQSSGVSFKVKVEANEGIWVTGSLEEIMRKSAVMDNINSTYVNNTTPGIEFGVISGDANNDGVIDNGKGVYMRAGTENDDYPIMYYRGDVDDNNVIFGDKCWKAVRTTDTGGVKIVYNGEKSIAYSKEFTNPEIYAAENESDIFTFDSIDSTWNYEINDGQDHEISFKVPAGDNYDIVVSGTTGQTCGLSFSVSKNKNQLSGSGGGGGSLINYTYTYGTLTSSDILKVSFYGAASTSANCSVNMKINMQQGTTKLSKNDYSMLVIKNSGKYGCDNSGTASQITLNVSGVDTNTFTFNEYNNSPAYVGYMYGTVYESRSDNWTNGAKFGSSFTWDGTNYKLVDATRTSPNATHHYSCNVTDANGTCNELRYVYYVYESTKRYITLTGGDGIEEALQKMQTNTTNSNAKAKIEEWYASNMTSFTNQIEDTIYCNDRSVSNNDNGWIANGELYNKYLNYAPHERSQRINSIILNCSNKNDAFTWKNEKGNKKLEYPVGMLTSDEIILAGAGGLKNVGGLGSTKSIFYLSTGNEYWTVSPAYFGDKDSNSFYLKKMGLLLNTGSSDSFGLRPTISIKPGLLITKGDGTAIDPYVIE